jgi:hypothetical protein
VYCGNYFYILWFSIGFKCTAGIIYIFSGSLYVWRTREYRNNSHSTLKTYGEPENIEIIPAVHLKHIENQRI